MSELKNTFSRLLVLSLLFGSVGISAPSAHAAVFSCSSIISRLFQFQSVPTPIKKGVKYRESHTMNTGLRGENEKPLINGGIVTYLEPRQLEKYRLHIKDGKVHDYKGTLLGKKASGPEELPRGREWLNTDFIYVMDSAGNIYFGKPQAGNFHHSSFFAGAPVVAAGHIEFENGAVLSVSNWSGHYTPPSSAIDLVLQELRESGIDVSEVKKEAFSHEIEYDDATAWLPQPELRVLDGGHP